MEQINWIKEFPWSRVDNSFGEEESWFDGIELWGAGWIEPVYDLCRSISEVLERNPGTEINVLQVKEKFGDFTMYWNSSKSIFKEIRELVINCEKECRCRCQICGAPAATSVIYGWVMNLCNKHREEMREELKGNERK